MDKREQGFEEEIRRKLSQSPVDFDEAAWEKMEQKLSAGASPRRRIIPLWWLRGAAAVVILGLGIWGYTGLFRGGSSDGELPANGYTNRELPESDALRVQPGEDDPGLALKKEEAFPDREDRPVLSGKENADRNRERALVPDQRNVGNRTRASQAGNDREALGGEDRGLAAAAGQPRGGRFTETGKELKRRTFSMEVPFMAGPLINLPTEQSLAVIQPGTTGLEGTRQETEGARSETEGTSLEPELDPAGRKIAFSLGVLAAPDLNGVKGFNGGKIGFNTGLRLGIHFNDRLSLHTGIVYSKKPYDALPSDYHTGRTLPESLTNIAANCDVIDIPLNLRYAFYRKGPNSIAVSAGLSSYLMLREKYSYNYEHYDARVYEYKNENRHFMGVGNAGIVFERRLNDNMSIGLQPFIKVPLTGIGHGNVKLISAGAVIQLSLDISKPGQK